MRNDALKIGKGFPAFYGAYLDTAATSLTPLCVLDAMKEYYSLYRASVHRGLYRSAETATLKFEEARAVVARFIGAETDEVVFTSGATESSNMLARMLESMPLKRGDGVVATVMEHHSSLVPLQELAKRKGLKLGLIPLEGARLDMKEAKRLIGPKTKIVSVALASNVLGTVNDVSKLAKLAHASGAVMATDATAAAGHIGLDVNELGVDFMYFSGHKMCGPTGIGVLYGKRELLDALEPGSFGGGMVDEVTRGGATWTDAPLRFEAGTPNVAGAIGLAEAVRHIESIGLDGIRAHVRSLTEYAIENLSAIRGLSIVSERDAARNVGIVSFTMKGVHPHDIAQVAAGMDVAIRAGHHCAEPLMRELGLAATARASFYLYNTKKDIDELVRSIEKAMKVFKLG